MMLSENETHRYARQTLLGEIGVEGQLRFKRARVLVIGTGGLGNPCAVYLAAAGVGTIGLVDDDAVSLSNLQRQILFTSNDLGKSKTDVAFERLHALNPEIQIISHDLRLSKSNAHELFLGYDYVIDASDNFQTRSLISEFCLITKKTHIFAGISRFEGQLAVFHPESGPCYRCLVPDLPGVGEVPNCSESGVIGAIAGVIGSMQALATLRLILNNQIEKRKDEKTQEKTTLTVFNGAPSLSAPMMDRFGIPERQECQHHALRKIANATKSGGALASGEHPLERMEFNEILSNVRPERAELLARDEWISTRFWPRAPIWIDVRDLEEAIRTPVFGAIEIPLRNLKGALPELKRDANYILFCQSGKRSQLAQDLMQENGFDHVWNLRGGLNSNDLHPNFTTSNFSERSL